MPRKEEEAELIYKDESYAIIGACFAVYGDKGCGFLEPVHHECLEIELELSISGSENFASFRVFGGLQNIPAQRGAHVTTSSKNRNARPHFPVPPRDNEHTQQ